MVGFSRIRADQQSNREPVCKPEGPNLQTVHFVHSVRSEIFLDRTAVRPGHRR